MQVSDSNIILDIRNLSCGYGGKPVIADFNLQVARGDVVAITGPNGCGKSTLLKAIYQLCIINNGEIKYQGEPLTGKTPEKVRKLGIAWFMQKNAVFPRLSVKENLVLSLNGMSRQHKKVKEEEIIGNFPEIGAWLAKPAGLLSGGQRQQLALAMLFTQEADLWLLDEPTAGLDAEKIELFLSSVQQFLGKKMGNFKTIIFVEHKTQVIDALAKRIINFKNKDHENNC